MSAIHAGSVISAIKPPSSDVVTLSGDGNTAFSFGQDCHAYHILRTDGTFDEQDNASSPNQINVSTDWIIPNGSAPGSYRVTHTANSGDTGASWWFPAGLINTYLSLTSQRTYRVTDTTTFSGGKSVTYTLSIDDGTTVQDTGSYTLTADREDF